MRDDEEDEDDGEMFPRDGKGGNNLLLLCYYSLKTRSFIHLSATTTQAERKLSLPDVLPPLKQKPDAPE